MQAASGPGAGAPLGPAPELACGMLRAVSQE